ncbi:hypothetical protein DICA3_C02916 [Diutina catenulata]
MTSLAGPRGLDDLPVEVIRQIAAHLNQYDCLSLMRTGRTPYVAARHRLHDTVVVDPDYSMFNNADELGETHTFINRGYSLARFFANSHPALTRRLRVSLPHDFNVYDSYDTILEFFSRAHLHQLSWLGEGFAPEFESALQGVSDLELTCKTLGRAPNVRALRFQPFHSTEHLRQVLTSVDASRLHHLWLNKQHNLDAGTLLPNIDELVVAERTSKIQCRLYDIDLDTIASLPSMPALRSLSLEDVVVVASDACKLAPVLAQVHTLRLLAVSECVTRDLDPQASFLLQIAPSLGGLRHLALDYRQPSIDSVPQFLSQLSPKLESLDLTVRVNTTKTTRFGSYRFPAGVRKLSIEVRSEIAAADATSFQAVMPMPPQLISAVERLPLVSLRCNYCPNLAKFPHLQTLDMFGACAPGLAIFDASLQLEHRVRQYFIQSSRLQYVRDNTSVFCRGSPRHGLNKWFDSQVRV